MWLSEYVTGRSFEKESAVSGEVRGASKGNVAVSSTCDYTSLPMIAPAGIAYLPVEGAKTVIVNGAGGTVCLGVIDAPPQDLEAGELMLYSAGGASLVLKNNGKVLINGREVG